MTGKRDSSLTFSLAELESLEKERISGEQREREARARRHEEAQARIAERARRAEEARVAAEAEHHRQEEARRRAEQAQAEALLRAEVERVRAEVESRNRMERERAAQLNAIELEKVRALSSRRHHRVVLGASGVAIVCLGALTGWLSVELRRLESRKSEAEARSTMDRDAYERAARSLDMTRREAEELRRALDTATRGGAGAPGSTPGTLEPVARPSKRRGAPPRTPMSAGCANDGDPMNGCLPR